MLDKPDLKDEHIAACLEQNYHLAVRAIEFLPLGYDANAGVYRVQAQDAAYFLKAKRDQVSPLSLRLPHYLKEHGIPEAVAPLPTVSQGLHATIDPFTLILYPFIEALDADLAGDDWVAFGAAVARLHAVPLPPDLRTQMPVETFAPPARHVAIVEQLQAEMGRRTYDHPLEQALAACWQEHRQEIAQVAERAGRLGHQLQTRGLAVVLCHADIHTGNLLLDAQRNLYIVDWDQPVLAPKERDLLFVTVGGFVNDSREEALFFEGYGPAVIDPVALAYYRYERALEDLAEFAVQILATDSSDETRQNALHWFKVQFAPGSLIEAAHALDPITSFE